MSARPWARWVPGRRRGPGKEHTALSEQTRFSTGSLPGSPLGNGCGEKKLGAVRKGSP